MRTYFSRCILLFGILLIPALAVSQSDVTEDDLYKWAREAAFKEGNFDKARKLAYRALEQSPNYYEIRVFVGRTYGWENKFQDSREEFKKVLKRDPGNREALLALVDVEIWAENYEKALEWTEKGLKSYPKDKELLLARASVFDNLERYREAEQMYENTLELYPENRKAIQGLKSVRLKQMRYGATLSFRHDRFHEQFEPWNIWRFELSRETKYGPVQANVQHANMFDTTGVQFNIDAYPTIYEGLYAHVNAGYSGSAIFPHYRYGLSLHKSLPFAFELEGGFRRLDFTAKPVNIYTLALNKYWKSYLFTTRTYLVPSSEEGSKSVTVLARRYFTDPSTYVSVLGGFGSGSANVRFANDLGRLGFWTASVKGQYPLHEKIYMGGEIGFDSEEFPNFRRDRFSVRMMLTYRF